MKRLIAALLVLMLLAAQICAFAEEQPQTYTDKKNRSVTMTGWRVGKERFEEEIPLQGTTLVFLQLEMENGSDSRWVLSSLMDFTAVCDGKKLNWSIAATCAAEPSADITLQPGDKVQIEYGMEVKPNWKEIVVVFDNNSIYSEPQTYRIVNDGRQ